jgi:lipopolysaccharide export system protein LptC
MESPVMTGVRKDGRPYRVAARETVEDVGGGGDMEMTGVSATLNTDGARLDVTSNSGFYSKARETMRLHGDVVFRTSANAMLTASDADIGFKDNSLHATGGPVVVAEGRTTDADAVDMLDNGDHVVFTGNVHSTVAGSPGDPAPPGAEPPVAGAAAGGTATAAPAADTPAGAARGNDAGAAAPAEQPRHEDRARKNAAARARKKPPRAARPPKRPFGL